MAPPVGGVALGEWSVRDGSGQSICLARGIDTFGRFDDEVFDERA